MMTHVLVGKRLAAVWIADDRMALKFEVDGGDPVVARTVGDCCSHTWIEDVENPEALVGAPILTVDDLDMPDRPESRDDDGDCTQYYGVRITTAKGTCVIDYRNASNGYYGGSLHWPDEEYYYGGVFGQNVSTEVWRALS